MAERKRERRERKNRFEHSGRSCVRRRMLTRCFTNFAFHKRFYIISSSFSPFHRHASFRKKRRVVRGKRRVISFSVGKKLWRKSGAKVVSLSVRVGKCTYILEGGKRKKKKRKFHLNPRACTDRTWPARFVLMNFINVYRPRILFHEESHYHQVR